MTNTALSLRYLLTGIQADDISYWAQSIRKTEPTYLCANTMWAIPSHLGTYIYHLADTQDAVCYAFIRHGDAYKAITEGNKDAIIIYSLLYTGWA